MLRNCLFIALVFGLGCGKSTAPPATPHSEADPQEEAITEADFDFPENYAAAITQIKGYRGAIQAAVDQGQPANAHRPLDELDIVLDKLPSIAKASKIPIEQWETINLTARELRNLFNQVHAAIDEHRPPDFQDVAQPINEAIAKLEQVKP